MKKARNPAELRSTLAARDLTYRELARLVGCSHATIGFVLDGRVVGDDFAKRIARALRRSTEALFVPATSSNEQADDQQRAAS